MEPNTPIQLVEPARQVVIHFPFDRATPAVADLPLLAEMTDFLLARPEVAVDIEGHTCQLGSQSYNDRLGQRRAEAIRKYLVEAGIVPRRVSQLSSHGGQQPVCTETSENCLRRNRRAVLLLVKKTGN